MIVRTACLGAGLLITALLLPVTAEESTCSNFQSPRNIGPNAPYNGTSDWSIVERILTNNRIVYRPRAGGPYPTLYLCGQHYHFPIETPQGCNGEIPPAGLAQGPGQYVEIHTVYAANQQRPPGCDPETLNCCTTEPILVRGFIARVTAGGQDRPIVPPTGFPLAEWTGSATSPDSTPGECKAPAVQWSFRLTCGETVSEAQLRRFRCADRVRLLQQGGRVSQDLTRVVRVEKK